MLTAPSADLAIAPASSPSAMKQRVPTTSIGIAIHHEPVRVQAESAAPRPRKIAIWARAMATVTATLAPTMVRVRGRRELESAQQL